MAIEAGLYAHLVGSAGVTALVATRVYPLLVPQDATLPAIAYQRISGPRDHTHDGPSGVTPAARFIRARTPYEAKPSIFFRQARVCHISVSLLRSGAPHDGASEAPACACPCLRRGRDRQAARQTGAALTHRQAKG